MKKLNVLLSLLLVASATTAFAATETRNILTETPVVPAYNIMSFGGATAQSPGLTAVLKDICENGTSGDGGGVFYSWTDGNSGSLLVNRVHKCYTASNATNSKLTGITGPWIVLKAEAGSRDSINPLKGDSYVSQLAGSDCVTDTILHTGTCTAKLASTYKLHLGFSDVKSTVFSSKNLLSGSSAFSADTKTGGGQGFGVVVSPDLYTLLQTDQNTSGIPSISKAQMATLMTKTSNLWKALLPNGTAHNSAPLTLARRSTSSGTQMAAEMFFLNNPCSAGGAGVVGSLSATDGSSSTATPPGTTYGSGQDEFVVRQEGTSDGVLTTVGSGYAIGVVSLENVQPASSWKYVAIDGVFPWVSGGTSATDVAQKTNLLNGKYGFQYETYINSSTAAALGNAATNNTIANNLKDFKTALITYLSKGSNTLNMPGIYGDPLASGAETTGTTTNTNHYSRNGRDCATPQLVF